MMDIQPVTLEGRHVQIEPLTLDHAETLAGIGLEEEIWRWMPVVVRTPEDMRGFVEAAVANQACGKELPFAVLEQVSGRAVGSTRYMNIDRDHRRVEIGWTWYAAPWRRTAINTDTKYLLLRHAFETLGCIRVEFKTDSLNVRSREALLRIGAKEEGVFRNHMVTPSGRIRHSVYFSIVAEDWPDVKTHLEGKLTVA